MSDGHSLKPIHGIHKGQPGIIIGAGPRLRHLKTEWLDGFITFAVNSGFLKYPQADYYVSCDGTNTVHQHWQDLAKWNGTAFIHGPGGFQADAMARAGLVDGRFYSFRRRRLMYPCKIRPHDEKTVVGYNSVHPAAHIAYLMGCDPIILVGCDCGWEDRKCHFYDFEGQPKDPKVIDNALANASIAYKQRETGPDGNMAAGMQFWGHFARENKHVNIINASGGHLEAFPKIAMSDIPTLRTKHR